MLDTTSGIVYLVGAGPGNPGLVTARALELIANADTILYDRLIPRRLLEGAAPGAELVHVGKEPGGTSTSQGEINARLIELARQGKRVVRLKGGDPFVFGRGGEEAEALAAASIPFEVVPGITAGVAAPAFAGIPVTHRDEASAVAFVTGHEDPDKDESALDWSALAAFPGTLVFYMGVRNLHSLAARLIEHGRSGAEPAAVIERGSVPGQRTVLADLGSIADRAETEGIRAPAVTVVGTVAALRDRLAWFEHAPLHGKVVAVTRARAQSSGLAARLATLGADVLEAPAIRIEPRLADPAVARCIERLSEQRYDVVCLTSPNGAEILLEAVGRAGLDARVFAGTTIAAIGPGTASALARHGLRADVVPERSIAEALAEELERGELADKRVLIARASEARDVLPERLSSAGATVELVALYDTGPEQLDEEQRSALQRADYVTFTSSSTVRFLLDVIGGTNGFPGAARVVSIGPVTSATARELGLRIDVEADQHDIDGLVAAIVADASRAEGPAGPAETVER